MSEQRREKKVEKRQAREAEGRAGLMRVFRRDRDDETPAE
jgi:hypothetical protein